MCRFIVYIHRYTSFLTEAALTKAASTKAESSRKQYMYVPLRNIPSYYNESGSFRLGK